MKNDQNPFRNDFSDFTIKKNLNVVLYEIYSVKSRVADTYVHWLYFNINKNERHCPIMAICKTGQVEDENHFILKCKTFEQIRLKFYDKVYMSKTLNF
jgi:hypothetical protein